MMHSQFYDGFLIVVMINVRFLWLLWFLLVSEVVW